ncbi:mitochondrial import inner membrane translocase subunit Tim21 isoform X1 [Bubalus bubalis]|uniref:mitochondrial import inner membrane translocase subunit Tim21 isoform X1 n=1 Tax=Bubalus bubalis TaxID=89462 RepID=UPI000DBC8FF7|nr:mitochondrial import inner membrane translocase subunit Tim21 isoform X1 [Bubalus bubalis]
MGAPGSHGFCHTPCLTELARRLSPGGDGGCKSTTRRRDLGVFGESPRDPSGRKYGAPRARRRTAASKCLCTGVRVGKPSSQRHRKTGLSSMYKANFPGFTQLKIELKEAGRDFTYLIVVLIGITITGGLFYTIFRELFSSSSPNKIYGKALEKCRSHPEVISVFGEPVKGYGEATRRGRRQHVSFIEYMKDGLKHMRVKFYIQGSEPGKQGTVHLEVKENPESGEYEFRYIFVELEPYSRTIVIEDNRS